MKKKSSYILPFFPSFERTEMLEKDYREPPTIAFLSKKEKRYSEGEGSKERTGYSQVDNESISRIRYVGHDTCQIHRP